MPSLLEENNLQTGRAKRAIKLASEQAFGQRWLPTRENNALFAAAHRHVQCGLGRRRPR